MINRSFEGVTKVFLENFQKSKQNILFMFEYFDKLLIWVVGFSVGGFQ